MYIILFCIIAIVLLICLNQTVTLEPFYQTLNMSSGESPYKCGSCKYGPTFDYKAQKSDRTYGVPNGCQKIF